MSNVDGAMCWPEQEAVWAWMKRHNIQLTHEQETDLKNSVSAFRIEQGQKFKMPEIHVRRDTICEHVTGSCSLNVLRVERNDDDSLTVITDGLPVGSPNT